MAVDMKNELEKNSIILSVLSNYHYAESINDMMKSIKGCKICYVDLNKGTDATIKNFKANGIDTKNVFFIDGVTLTMNQNAKFDNAILLSSPYALTEMGIAISEVMKSGSFDILVFDSLSTLNMYSKEIKGASGRFASHIVNRLRSNKNKGVLTCLENDTNSDLIKQSTLFVDKVLMVDAENAERAEKSKAVTLVMSLLTLGAFSLLYSQQNNATAFAVSDSGSFSANSPLAILSVAALFLAISLLAIIYLKRPKPVKAAPANIPERKDNKTIRREFRSILNRWIKNIKELGLF